MENFKFDSDIVGYKMMLEEIRAQLESGSEEIIPIRNDSFEHAVVLTSDILRHHGKNTVSIYSTSLCKPFYEHKEIQSALQKCTNDDVKIRIIVREKKGMEKDVAKRIEKMEKSVAKNLKAKFGAEIRRGNVTAGSSDKLNDFIVVGDSFRYEKKQPGTNEILLHRCNARDYSVEAVAALWDRESAEFLENCFNDAFKSATPIC